MAIKIKNQDDFIIHLAKTGSVGAANDVAGVTLPFAASLVAVFASTATAGSNGGSGTANVAIDINKNGTTILSTNKLVFGYTSPSRTPSSYGDFATLTPVAFAKGDFVSFDIDTVFAGSSPAPVQPTGLGITLVFRRKGSLPGLTVTGSAIAEGSE